MSFQHARAPRPASQLSIAALQAKFRSFNKAAGTPVSQEQKVKDRSVMIAAGYTVEGRKVMR